MKVEINVTDAGTFIEIDGAPAVSSACSAADGGTSGTEAISGDPQRSADRPRKIHELIDQVESAVRLDDVVLYKDRMKALREAVADNTAR